MKCDAKAFSKLYEQVYQDLYRYALCLMRDPHEAEDAVSAAVLSAMNIYINFEKKKLSRAGFLQFCQIHVRKD